MFLHRSTTLCLTLVLAVTFPGMALADEPWEFGFAKLDITPTEPVRLSGYGNRVEPHEGVADPLSVRAMALRAADDLQVLVSIDTIGLPASLSDAIHRAVAERHGLSRGDLAICGTHSHTAPQLAGALSNLLAVPLTEAQQAATERYTDFLKSQTIAAIDRAIDDLAPGRLRFGTGTAGFAAHRRVIQDGRWTGFGVDPEGPVDHSAAVLRIDDAEGRPRGIVFNYACHCTTLGPDFNRISGDWAGIAAAALEAEFDTAIAMSTIGCGADANPEPRGQLDMAKVHGRTLAQVVAEVVRGEMKEITAAPVTAYGYAGLPIERTDVEVFRARVDDPSPQTQRHARNMLEIHQRMGRLPESYPAPVQTWRFGDQLAMVFLGGEVVSEYALRLKRELSAADVWVSAYANDLFGYVASERMREEGGYEVDGSMIFYNHPGRWAAGTEDVLIGRVHELIRGGATGPLSPEQGTQSFVLPPGYQIELVVAEPMVTDPVNLAFDTDGSVWVVEMGDYPRGAEYGEGHAGRIKHLRDEDKDGRFDAAEVFLDELSFPSGVLPWRGGVFVSAAPEIFYASDTDGDGTANTREVVFSGFAESNPQHRVNGFALGLDGWIYVAGGSDNGDIVAHRTGETISVGRRDFRFHPDHGTLQVLSGESQFGRARDAWGNWFGNTNSRPGYQYVLEDHHLQRNPFVAISNYTADVFDPPHVPPVFPASRTEDRFNDLFTANRFTSACSPAIYHGASPGAVDGAWMLVCEPVHNLVHRQRIWRDGAVFRGQRLAEDAASEFIASTDGWSRPVSVAAGPDGAIWVVDMYRHVIEHPQWIPEHWQARLNLRAGEDRGRIYRVFSGTSSGSLPNLRRMSTDEVVEQLRAEAAPLRNLAQQELLQRADEQGTIAAQVRAAAQTAERAESRVQSLATLAALGQLSGEDLRRALSEDHPEVLRFALRQIEQRSGEETKEVFAAIRRLADHQDRGVRFATALALWKFDTPDAAGVLAELLAGSDDPFLQAAVISSAVPHARELLERMASDTAFQTRNGLRRDLLSTAFATDAAATLDQLVASSTENLGDAAWNQLAAAAVFDYIDSQDKPLENLTGTGAGQGAGVVAAARADEIRDWLRRTCAAALGTLRDEAAPLGQRVEAARSIARAEAVVPGLVENLAEWLSPSQPYEIQSAVVRGLVDRGSPSAMQYLLERTDRVSPRVRTEILLGLASHRRGAALVAERIAAGQLAAGTLDENLRESLLAVAGDDLRPRLVELFRSGASSALRSDVIEQFANIDPTAGSPERGAQVFTQHCAVCHRSEGDTAPIGPNLDGLSDRSTAALLTAIFAPSDAIETRYGQYRVLTLDGRLRAGVIAAESSASVSLGKADGTTERLLRRDIQEISPAPQSLMPSGLEQNISRDQLVDLLAYLQRG